MKTRWIGVALTVAWLGLTVAARAQGPMSEPLPVAPSPVATQAQPAYQPPPGSPPGQLPPDAMSPRLAPMPAAEGSLGPNPDHPKPDMTLPATVPGAFTDCPPEDETGTYFHLGGMALQRERPGQRPLAIVDLQNPTNLDTGALPQVASQTQTVLSTHDINPQFSGGITGTIGYMWGGNAIELSGFYVFDKSASANILFPGRLDSFFNNPPLGFEGDNGLWRQADYMSETMHNRLGSAELNYRWWNTAITSAEGLIGLRYFDQNENLTIYTDDDGATIRNSQGQPDPTRAAIYRSRTHNHLAAPQLGFEWHLPLTSCVAFSLEAKGAWGVNYINSDFELVRGDAFFGRAGLRYDTVFSHAYEAGFFLDFWLLERARLRAGYNLFYLCNVADVTRELNFDLAHPIKQGNIELGNIFYHGPTVEFEFLF